MNVLRAIFSTGTRRGVSTRVVIAFVLTVVGVLGVGVSSSVAALSLPVVLRADALPTSFSASDNAACLALLAESSSGKPCDSYQVTATNTSSGNAGGNIVMSLSVPAGLEVHKALLWRSSNAEVEVGSCEPAATPVVCEYPEPPESAGGPLAPDQSLEMRVYVTVKPGAVSGEAATASVRELAKQASLVERDLLDSPPSFGAKDFLAEITNTSGLPFVQAGGHPYEMNTRIDANTVMRVGPSGPLEPTSVQDVKDVAIDLPLGVVGSAIATPRCTMAQLTSLAGCPADTQIGHLQSEPGGAGSVDGPLFNVVPEYGAPAEFGYVDVLDNSHVIYTSVVPTSSGYVLRATAPDVPQAAITDIIATIYGNPGARDGGPQVAMLTNPSVCTGKPLQTTVHMDSWQNPGAVNADGLPDVEGPGWASTVSESPAVTGCNLLSFKPSAFTSKLVNNEGDSEVVDEAADSPAGLAFDLQLPQPEEPKTLGTPPLKDATVTLPAGVVVNPAAASGLEACSIAQIGWLGGSVTNFTPDAPTCPDASKIGSVEVTSPLLATPLEGSVYLARQDENPFNSLLAGYIVIDDPTTGTIVKIAGKLETNPATGQITGTFDENPQLPFSDLKLHFFGGARGELATPEGCGSYTTSGELEPWSAPESGPNALVSDSFPVTTGCTPGFAPAFTAGTANPQAGAYEPFTLTFSRQDDEQEFSGLTATLPPGLVGKLAGVSECSDAELAAAAANPSGAAEQANPECPANSRIGSVQSSAGVGSQPFTLGGTAYLTGPYKGAPYGVAVVVPALAGPFDLGNVVVRSRLNIDPNDAHVTVTSDAFPTIIDAKGADGQPDGFPIRLRSIAVTMDRPSFTLNPTSCTPASINATLASTAGATAAVAAHFQVGACGGLAFKPSLAVSTVGKASKANGANLDVKVIYPSGAVGSYANIKTVKVELPKQLPSRLTTLQKACLAATFEANPANCSPESNVGTAVATTPLLSNPLMGPAYLVSHGNEAFPDLEIVLQGEGITLVLDGNTLIKNGITSSTFKTVPDAPVSSFELKLPAGPFSILGANVPQSAHYSLCGQTLTMPTQITGQNGASITQTTKISITGCPKVKALTRAQKLTKALQACHKDRSKKRRATCEKKARKQFGAVKKNKKQTKRGK
jgi:hypothetical protein